MSEDDHDSSRTETVVETPQLRPLTNLPTLNHAVWELKRLRPPLFQGWVEEHSKALALSGLRPSELKDHKAVWHARHQLSGPVLDGLADLHRLADEEGVVILSRVLRRRGHPTVHNDWPIELAVRTRLEHPSCFFEALQQRRVPTPPFTELQGKGPLTLHWTKALHKRLHDRLETLLGERIVELKHWMERGLHHFLIVVPGCKKAGHTASDSRIQSFEVRGFLAHLLVLDPRIGNLRLGPCDAQIRSAYASGFGELVGDDPSWFSASRVVRLERLAELGRNVLTPTKGLVAVRLVEMVLDQRGAAGRQYTERDKYALEQLDRLYDNPLRCGIPRSVTFSMQPASDSRPQPVTISVPHQVQVSWRLDSVARTFFEARGLLLGGR